LADRDYNREGVGARIGVTPRGPASPEVGVAHRYVTQPDSEGDILMVVSRRTFRP
jgi:hypothetical protein